MVIGIIGLGNFGSFAAGLFAGDKDLRVVAHDPGTALTPEGVKRVSLEGAGKADVVVLCVPLAAYKEVLSGIRPYVRPEALVIDICSVKTEADAQLRKYLSEHQNLLVTHPMFGALSAAGGTDGHTLVVTGALGERAEKAIRYGRARLGLKILRMTNEEHDKVMAEVHALTFFVARGLARAGLTPAPFQAPSFQMLLDLVVFDQAHSDDLFATIELGNPFAEEARQRLLASFAQVEAELQVDKREKS